MYGKTGLWSLFRDRTTFTSGCFLSTGIIEFTWSDSIWSFLSGRKLNLESRCLSRGMNQFLSSECQKEIGLWSLFRDRTAFTSGCFLSTGIKGIKWSDSICSFLSRRKLHLGSFAACFVEGSNSYQVSVQKRTNAEGKVWRYQAWLVCGVSCETYLSSFQDAFSALESKE